MSFSLKFLRIFLFVFSSNNFCIIFSIHILNRFLFKTHRRWTNNPTLSLISEFIKRRTTSWCKSIFTKSRITSALMRSTPYSQSSLYHLCILQMNCLIFRFWFFKLFILVFLFTYLSLTSLYLFGDFIWITRSFSHHGINYFFVTLTIV